jgi:hypothetical protein
VWAHERFGPALSDYVKTSDSTKLVNQPVGTLHDGTHVDTTTTKSTTQLDIPTVSMNSTNQSHTTHAAISSTIMSTNTIVPTYYAMSTNTTLLTGLSFNLSFSTSLQCHSKIKPGPSDRQQ